jgi:hypothetical protein
VITSRHQHQRRTAAIIASRPPAHDFAIWEYRRCQSSLFIASALKARRYGTEASMIDFKVLGLAAILSAATAPAISGQMMFREPVVYASNETATRPWSAPVGHRQPRAADLPGSLSNAQPNLDPDDAEVDRKIKAVCRGC